MATLKVLGRYRSGLGSFEPGQVLTDLTDEAAELLLRDSPGSFAPAGAGTSPRVSAPASAQPPQVAPDDDADDDEDDFDPTGAMSSETATGLVAPDRRARGGRRREA